LSYIYHVNHKLFVWCRRWKSKQRI